MLVKCIKENYGLIADKVYLVLECSKNCYRIIADDYTPALFDIEDFEIADSDKSRMVYDENNGNPIWTHKAFLNNFWESYFNSNTSIELLEYVQLALDDLNSVHNIDVFSKGNLLSAHLGYKTVEPEYAKRLRKQFIYNYVDTSDERYNKDSILLRDILKEDLRFAVDYQAVLDYLKELNSQIYIMWDIRPLPESDEIKEDSDKYFFVKHKDISSDTVISLNSRVGSCYIGYDNNDSVAKPYLNRLFPEDIYIFDDSLDWYISITHSFVINEAGRNTARICYSNIPL